MIYQSKNVGVLVVLMSATGEAVQMSFCKDGVAPGPWAASRIKGKALLVEPALNVLGASLDDHARDERSQS